MKSTTKTIFTILVAITLLTFTACSNNSEASSSAVDPAPSSEVTEATTESPTTAEPLQSSSSASSSAPSSSAPESSASSSAPEEGSSAPAVDEGTQSEGEVVFDLSSGEGTSITESSSFEADDGDVLTLEITSTISGGPVDLFLFSPDNQEQRISIGNTTETQTITLSAGEWAYNCTGFFDSGSIQIVGRIA